MIRFFALSLLVASAVPAEETMVERRILRKEGHVVLVGGPCWLVRGDGYLSPGLEISASWFRSEKGGLEVRLAGFTSFRNGATEDIFNQTGLVPNALKPVALATGGWQWTLGYGKLAAFGGIVHFDALGGVGGGMLVGDRGVAPLLDASLGVLARFSPLFHVRAALAPQLSFDDSVRGGRRLVPGMLATIGAGVSL